MNKEVTKKPYSPPKLVVYGTVAELTQSASGSGHDVTSGRRPSSWRFKEDIQDMGDAIIATLGKNLTNAMEGRL